MSFQRIYTYVTDKCPQLAPKNTQIIHEWLSKGYDVEQDIIPSIDRATKNGASTIHSFSYFSGYIRSDNEKRIKEALKPKEYSTEERSEMRAKTINIKLRAGMYVPDSELEWLERKNTQENTA